jgi:HK97 family phage portal protein
MWPFTSSPAVAERREPAFGAAGQVSSTDRPDEWFFEALGGRKTASGQRVNPSTAMRISAVYAAVQLRAGTLAQCPLFVYRRRGADERVIDDRHPLYVLLHDQPNPWQTSMDFIQMQQMHVDLRGNAYARIVRDGTGRVTALTPMHPAAVTVLRSDDGAYFYDWHPPRGGRSVRLPQREVMHLRGMSDDGELGISRITMARERLGITMAAEEYSAKFLANDARPSVAIKHPKTLSEPTGKRLKEQWQQIYGGSSKAGGTAILEEGMEIQTIAMTNRDAQFLELMQFSVKDIARFFDVPGFLIGDDAKVATYASAEQSVLMFEKFTMVEIARNWEQTLRRDVLREDEQEKWFAEFSLQALTRGDFQTRTEGYQRSVGRPWQTVNEARRLENMPPVEGGNDLFHPLNMEPSSGAPSMPKRGRQAPDEDDEPEDDE